MAALGVESAPLLTLLSSPRPHSPRLVVGRIAGREVGVLTVGVGPAKAERRTRAALARWPAGHVVSVGTCGALVEDLPTGTLVEGAALWADAAPQPALHPLGACATVGVVTVPAAVWQAARRSQLAAMGAQICEMEAAAVAAAARATRSGPIPLVSALKVVSDLAGGEADPIIGPAGLPDPARIARFKARALRLSRQHLAPAVDALLSR